MRQFWVLSLLLPVIAACNNAPEPEGEGQAGQTAEPENIVFVSQKAGNSVAFYTLAGELLKEIPVNPHPHEVVLSEDGSRLYVTDNGTMAIEIDGMGGNKISIIDMQAREKIGEVDLGQWHRPHGIDLCRDGTLLVTSENPDRLLLINPETMQIETDYSTGGETPHIVKCSPDSSTAYVSNARSRTVSFVDLETGEYELLETGARPEGSTLNADGSRLYVVHRDDAKIAVIDTENREVLGEIQTGETPVRVGVTADEQYLAYGLFSEQKVGVASLATMEQIGELDLAGEPVSLEMAPDGQRALTCAQNADVCYVVSVPEIRILHEFKTREGAGPDPALLLVNE